MPPDSADKRTAAAKPRARVSLYDTLLMIAFFALVLGCLVLYLEWAAYPTIKAAP